MSSQKCPQGQASGFGCTRVTRASTTKILVGIFGSPLTESWIGKKRLRKNRNG
ncbi:hypothetical protein PT286_04440 [Neisseriaceae bacterium ESL0693]|nr:hypothetical protein [Neisseriaceae bacterium ESL0693]